jgi:hypothetical protein
VGERLAHITWYHGTRSQSSEQRQQTWTLADPRHRGVRRTLDGWFVNICDFNQDEPEVARYIIRTRSGGLA